MEIPGELLTEGASGWFGYILAVIAGGLFFLRRLYHNDLVSSAKSHSAVDQIKRYNDLLDLERANAARLHDLLAEANARLERAQEERNKLIIELSQMRAEISSLKLEVKMLRERYEYEKSD